VTRQQNGSRATGWLRFIWIMAVQNNGLAMCICALIADCATATSRSDAWSFQQLSSRHLLVSHPSLLCFAFFVFYCVLWLVNSNYLHISLIFLDWQVELDTFLTSFYCIICQIHITASSSRLSLLCWLYCGHFCSSSSCTCLIIVWL